MVWWREVSEALARVVFTESDKAGVICTDTSPVYDKDVEAGREGDLPQDYITIKDMAFNGETFDELVAILREQDDRPLKFFIYM